MEPSWRSDGLERYPGFSSIACYTTDHLSFVGSCALEYRLVRIPKALQDDGSYVPGALRHIIDRTLQCTHIHTWHTLTILLADDPFKTLFVVLWTLFLFFVLYHILKSCFTRSRSAPPPSRPASRPSGGGWFPGYRSDDTDPPPPYSRNHKPSTSAFTGWTPGFWTGLGLGGLGASMWGRWRDPDPRVIPQRSFWDWERPTSWGGWSTARQTAPPATASGGWFGGAGSGSRRTWSNDNRGEGTSNLGTMRSSSGWGGSSVR